MPNHHSRPLVNLHEHPGTISYPTEAQSLINAQDYEHFLKNLYLLLVHTAGSPILVMSEETTATLSEIKCGLETGTPQILDKIEKLISKLPLSNGKTVGGLIDFKFVRTFFEKSAKIGETLRILQITADELQYEIQDQANGLANTISDFAQHDEAYKIVHQKLNEVFGKMNKNGIRFTKSLQHFLHLLSQSHDSLSQLSLALPPEAPATQAVRAPIARTLTLGDSHGNALKILHSLLRNNVIQMPQEAYSAYAKAFRALSLLGHRINQLEAQRSLSVTLYDRIYDMLTEVEVKISASIRDNESAEQRASLQSEAFLLNNALHEKNEAYEALDHAVDTARASFADESRDLITSLHQILQSSTARGHEHISVRLIGDILADRGPNDLTVIHLLSVLHTLDIPLTILYSNHDAIFIDYVHSNCTFKPTAQFSTEGFCRVNQQGNSLINFAKVYEQFADDDKVRLSTDIAQCYFNKISLINYHHDSRTNVLTLYTHAPVSYKQIKNLYRYYKRLGAIDCKYADSSIEGLMQSLDRLNEAFLKSLRDEKISRVDGGLSQDSPLGTFIWTRVADNDPDSIIQLPYSIQWVHGHCDRSRYSAISKSLNATVGFHHDEWIGFDSEVISTSPSPLKCSPRHSEVNAESSTSTQPRPIPQVPRAAIQGTPLQNAPVPVLFNEYSTASHSQNHSPKSQGQHFFTNIELEIAADDAGNSSAGRDMNSVSMNEENKETAQCCDFGFCCECCKTSNDKKARSPGFN